MATINALNNKSAPFTVTTGALTVTSGNVVVTSGLVSLPTTSSTVGQITINSVPYLHGYGTQNVFIGGAGNFTTTSSGYNICLGKDAGLAMTSGSGQQILIGVNAGKALTSTNQNIFIGYDAGAATNTGGNIFIGVETGKGASYSDPSWNERGNIYIGHRIAKTLSNNGNTAQSVVIGYEAMEKQSQNASGNVYIGYQCAKSINGNHSYNTFVGSQAGYSMTGASYPSASGLDRNTLIGYKAGYNYVSASQYNVILGHEILGTNGDQGIIRIGNTTNSTKAYVAGIYGVTPAGTLNIALIDSNHQFGSVASIGVANGGTGLATLTAHALYVGNGTSAPTALAVGATGEILVGATGADCAWSASPTVTTMYATTFDTNVTAAAVTLSGTTLSADGTDANIDINITAKGTGTVIVDELTLTTDLAVTEGGTGMSTLTAHALYVGNGASAPTALAVGATGEILVGATGADCAWSASPTVTTMYATTFDTNIAAAAVTLAGTTLSADGTDANININITAKGTGTVVIDELTLTADLAVTEGGTGASTLTDHGVLLGSGTGAITATAVGATGEIFVGATGADAAWLAAGDANKVLTAHGAGNAVTWETPGAGTTWLTKANATANVTPATVNYAYTINHATPATLLEITLPATATFGDRVEIVGNTSGMWKLIAATGDTIKLLSSTTSAGGYLLATTQYDCVEVVCTVENDTWVVCKSTGNLTIA